MGARTTVNVLLPTLGDTVAEATILEWHKSEGACVVQGELLAEVWSDEVDFDVVAAASGILVMLHCQAGDTVGAGAVLADIATSEEVVAGASDTPAQSAVEPQADAPTQRRRALLLACGTFDDTSLRQLRAPAQDAGAFAEVLAHDRIGGFSVRTIMDEPHHVITEAVEGFFSEANSTDLLLLYVSTHGILTSPKRKFYFAARNTRPSRLASTGVSDDFLRGCMEGTRARTTVVILDCCHSGAFAKGLVPKMAVDVGVVDNLVGEGCVVMTASSELEYAFEAEELSPLEPSASVFTARLVEGLRTGHADLDYDGLVSIRDLYDYVFDHVRERGRQTPRLKQDATGRVIIARSARSQKLPRHVQELLTSEDFAERLEALGVLAQIWRSNIGERSEIAEKALRQLQMDDDPKVAMQASTIVETALLQPSGRPPSDSPASPTDLDDEVLHAIRSAVGSGGSLVAAHRTHGHLAARLDPLGSEPEGDPMLDPSTFGLTAEIMASVPAAAFQVYVSGDSLADALPHLRETYCGTMAYEIEHLASHRQRAWLREKIESGAFRMPLSPDEQKALLKRLVEVDALERFMHKAYLGQEQFSIEGLDMTVPMLDEAIQLAAMNGGREVVLGMGHRGRLNVLAHNLGRPYDTIFAEFEGASTLEAVTTIPQGGTGEVKYQHGAQGSYQLPDGSSILVNLEPNPSHLEYVAPVVAGASRAAQTTRQGPHAHRDTDSAVPIVLHGDAALPAQGVVPETLNLQALDGYNVGGTLHLVQNNQVGFTTEPDDARSTRWASDIAKGFDVPIIHVNADDVAACIAAVRLAFAIRHEFGRDVMIDLIGYRRFGHNETDEPAYTQPAMCERIKHHKRVADIWAEQLIAQKVVSKQEVDRQISEVWSELTWLHQRLREQIKAAAEAGTVEQPTGEYQLDRTPSPEVRTAVSTERLLTLNDELLRVPEGFTVHPKLVKQLERRRDALGPDGGIDWVHAEALAFASLLTEGTPIRLTGQDVERGTFSQRHMVLHDARTGRTICPIQSLPGALAPLELHNSPLSEVACLGFEYGYSAEAPETLVLWEAQYGDFANVAQVIIDQFIASGLAKWGQTSRLVLLLPHGYEGSGPEHSSGRLERFLQMASEGNMRVANATTPAQYFHLIRRQAIVAKQRPLILMTPKSLLRLPQATNRIEHLTNSRFFPVLPEPRVPVEKVQRLALCTGKIYYDLVGHPNRKGNDGVAIGRLELLYPFPEGQVLELIESYPNLREVVWVQEEPRNMGARAHMFPRLMQILPERLKFGYIGRPERASTGEGYPAAHIAEQSRIIRTALDLTIAISMYPLKTPGER